MDNDRLVNLLPKEYLPEPEFKAFPIFAALLIILALLVIYINFDSDNKKLRNLNKRVKSIEAVNNQYIEDAQGFTHVQANARFIRSYLGVIPKLVLQAPDYWEIYNEIERNIPDDTWVNSVRFRPGVKPGWPDITVSFLSRGYGFNGPLQTYDMLMDTEEHPTRFRNLKMDGYHRISIAGGAAAAFEIRMEVKYPLPTVTAEQVEQAAQEMEAPEDVADTGGE